MIMHANESYCAVLSCGAVSYAMQGGSKFRGCGRNPKCDHSNENY